MEMIRSGRNSRFSVMKKSVIKKMRKNKNKMQIILDKEDIYAYITDSDTDRQTVRRVRKGKKKHDITISLQKN